MAAPPSAPPGFDAEKTFAGVRWYQKWEVFKGVITPGEHPIELLCERAQIPADLTGKRVLDIGAWNGCYCFECERRGASEVVAYSLENPGNTGFLRLKDVLGSRVKYVQDSVYSLSPAVLGEFDVILFFGVLYHLRYPLLAVDRIRSVSRGEVLIETHTLSSRFLLRWPMWLLSLPLGLAGLFRTTPIWRQYKEYELHPDDQSNWFGPNIKAVIEGFDTGGFRTEHLASWDYGTRSSFRAVCVPRPARLTHGTYEGNSSLHSQLTGINWGDQHIFRRD